MTERLFAACILQCTGHREPTLFSSCFPAQVNKLDWIVFNVALFCTMFAGVDIGLGISIGTSVVLALYKSAFPKTSMLGRLPDTTVYRCRPLHLPLLAAGRLCLPCILSRNDPGCACYAAAVSWPSFIGGM